MIRVASFANLADCLDKEKFMLATSFEVTPSKAKTTEAPVLSSSLIASKGTVAQSRSKFRKCMKWLGNLGSKLICADREGAREENEVDNLSDYETGMEHAKRNNNPSK